jgi:3',5'-cyclic AMP phosphodiesterase CpdA
MLVAQLSDIHVRPRGRLYKDVVDSNRQFSDAIAHLHGLDRRPDLVLITGDLVDEGHPDEYACLRELLADLRLPFRVIPGNHDSREALRAALPEHAYLPAQGPMHYCLDGHELRIVALDTSVPGGHHGALDDAGLAWLRATLQADPATPTLVLMHHPPFLSGIPYLDQYRYPDTEPLAEILRSVSNIEAVLCGHVHRTMIRRWAGTVVVCCPSTTTEIGLQLDARAAPQSWLGPPACLLHLWNPAQGLVSHVSQIGRYPGPYPFF